MTEKRVSSRDIGPPIVLTALLLTVFTLAGGIYAALFSGEYNGAYLGLFFGFFIGAALLLTIEYASIRFHRN